MGWARYYQRRDAIDAALAAAAGNPGGELPLTGLPAVERVFSDRTELLLAMQHRWTQQLQGRLELALERAARQDTDRVAAFNDAWQRTAAVNPVLREVLDTHLDAPTRPDRTADRQLTSR